MHSRCSKGGREEVNADLKNTWLKGGSKGVQLYTFEPRIAPTKVDLRVTYGWFLGCGGSGGGSVIR